MIGELAKIIKRTNIYTDEPLKKHSTFKIGGKCDYLLYPESFLELSNLISFIKKKNIPYHVVGNGSNILFSDDGFSGIIIKTRRLDKLTVSGNIITADSGVLLSKLCDAAIENSLDGIVSLSGIPGTVGGAVYMNAGAYGTEIKDVLIYSYYLDENSEIKKLSAEEHNFKYRHSFFTGTSNIILKSEFRLNDGDALEMKENTAKLLKKRAEKQPLNFPSGGSTFKRPNGKYAGELIQECGLKGYTIGGAQVSEKHSGFVINLGNATEKDIKALIEHIKNEVYKKYNIELEKEILYL